MKKNEKFSRMNAKAEVCKKHVESIFDSDKWESYDHDFLLLARAILTTDKNPWSFMPMGWQNATTSYSGMSSFLLELHHAMLDDSDLTFVSDNDRQFICFDTYVIALQTVFDSEYYYIKDESNLKAHRDVLAVVNFLNEVV